MYFLQQVTFMPTSCTSFLLVYPHLSQYGHTNFSTESQKGHNPIFVNPCLYEDPTVLIRSCVTHATDMVLLHSVLQKDGLNFIRLYFLNYTWHVNDLHKI